MEVYEFQPVDLEAVRDALSENLKKYYAEVSVTITDCPDLSAAPYNLAGEGFGEGTSLVDLGGVPYLLPTVNREKLYDLRSVVTKSVGAENYPDGWYLGGAGAGHWPSQGSNCELVINLKVNPEGELVKNSSKVMLTSSGDEKDVDQRNLDEEAKCALLGNFWVSPGVRGKVLEIKCVRRTDPDTNFTLSIREALDKNFPSQPVGLGGVFLVKDAPTRTHIMRDFSDVPLHTDAEVDEWLKFFEMGPPMLFQSVLVSSDPGLDLRIDHSHGWSLNPEKDEGGHYHEDTLPENVEYLGYYAVAQKLYRVDRPPTTN